MRTNYLQQELRNDSQKRELTANMGMHAILINLWCCVPLGGMHDLRVHIRCQCEDCLTTAALLSAMSGEERLEWLRGEAAATRRVDEIEGTSPEIMALRRGCTPTACVCWLCYIIFALNNERQHKTTESIHRVINRIHWHLGSRPRATQNNELVGQFRFYYLVMFYTL